jgi:hypothetical protein
MLAFSLLLFHLPFRSGVPNARIDPPEDNAANAKSSDERLANSGRVE